MAPRILVACVDRPARSSSRADVCDIGGKPVCLRRTHIFVGAQFLAINFRHAFICIALLSLALLIRSIDFMNLGVDSVGTVSALGRTAISSPGLLLLPKFLIVDIPKLSIWIWPYLLCLAISSVAIIAVFRDKNVKVPVKVLWAVIIIGSVSGQFVPTAILCVILFLTEIISIDMFWKAARDHRGSIICALLISITFTGALLVQSLQLSTFSDGLVEFLRYLEDSYMSWFDYPAIYQKIVRPWLLAMPINTVLLLISLIAAVWVALTTPNAERRALRWLVVVLIGLLCIVGVLDTLYVKARYSFFLYPILLVLVTWFLHQLATRVRVTKRYMTTAIFAISLAIFMILSEDFGWDHLRNISSPEINFRTAYSNDRGDIYFARRDYQTPAEYVNKNSNPNDIVLYPLMSPLNYYLDKTDYIYLSTSHRSFRRYQVCGGERERWSGAPLIGEKKTYLDLIQNSREVVWLIMYSDNWRSDVDIELTETYSEYNVYQSQDNTINVYRIPGLIGF